MGMEDFMKVIDPIGVALHKSKTTSKVMKVIDPIQAQIMKKSGATAKKKSVGVDPLITKKYPWQK